MITKKEFKTWIKVEKFISHTGCLVCPVAINKGDENACENHKTEYCPLNKFRKGGRK